MNSTDGIFGIQPDYLQMARLDGFATKYGTTKELSSFSAIFIISHHVKNNDLTEGRTRYFLDLPLVFS